MDERSVVLREVADADAEAACLHIVGDVVAAFDDALANAAAGDVEVGNPEEI